MDSLITDGPILSMVALNTNSDSAKMDAMIKNSERVFSHIPNRNNDITSCTGLLVGKIQSGKTANIITLTATAFDNGYRLAIIFLSDNNILLEQNAKRVKDAFMNIDDVKVYKQSNEKQLDNITNDEIEYLYNQGKKIIVCTLKHYKHIDKIAKKFSKTSYFKDYSLIIDDESDDVSQNTKWRKNVDNESKLEDEKERSTTFDSIIKLENNIEKVAYLSVTATPEANVFLQKYQKMSPSFVVAIEPGDGYFGLSDFHDSEVDKIFEINDFDIKKFEIKTYFPPSLYEALCFFVAGIVYRKKVLGQDGFKQSFLIHPSSRIEDQQNILDLIKSSISGYQYALKVENEKGKKFVEDVKKQYLTLGADVNDVILSDVKDILKKTKIHCINKDSDEKNLTEATEIFPYHIVIGGNMIDRGLTLPDLSVAYMTRESKIGQADTLLQRARWLGYKKDYFDICRIYLTPSLKEQYEDLIELDESVWQTLSIYSENNVDLKNSDVSFALSSDLIRPTSPSKAATERVSLPPTSIQKEFTHNKTFNMNNILMLKKYEDRDGTELVYNEVQTHKVINITVSELKDILKSFHFHDPKNDEGISLNNLLQMIDQQQLDALTPVDLVVMRYKNKEHEIRSTIDDMSYRIPNILQGRYEDKTFDSEGYYPGDRYIVGDKVMLQIHHIKLRNQVDNKYNAGDEVVMLALLFPKQYVLQSVVKRKEF